MMDTRSSKSKKCDACGAEIVDGGDVITVTIDNGAPSTSSSLFFCSLGCACFRLLHLMLRQRRKLHVVDLLSSGVPPDVVFLAFIDLFQSLSRENPETLDVLARKYEKVLSEICQWSRERGRPIDL